MYMWAQFAARRCKPAATVSEPCTCVGKTPTERCRDSVRTDVPSGESLPMIAARTFLGAMLAITLGGCSTHYQPRPGHRLSIVMESGSPAYYKDGETIEHGLFGGGLV